jgi:hypothetical protein
LQETNALILDVIKEHGAYIGFQATAISCLKLSARVLPVKYLDKCTSFMRPLSFTSHETDRLKPVFFFARDAKLKSTQKFDALVLLIGLTFKHVIQVTASLFKLDSCGTARQPRAVGRPCSTIDLLMSDYRTFPL